MDHWISIVGAVFGIAGTLALSFDLLKSKSDADSIRQFTNLQDQVDNASLELAVRMNGGLATLAHFIAGYLSLLVVQAQLAEQGDATDPGLAAIKEVLSGKSPVEIQQLFVVKFTEAQQKLPSPTDTQKALTFVAKTRKEISDKYAEEVSKSRRLRRVATIGVGLVGVGAIAQLLAQVLAP